MRSATDKAKLYAVASEVTLLKNKIGIASILGIGSPRIGRGWTLSDEELEKTLEAIEKLREEHTASPERAKAFLIEAGFITPDGELTEHYRQDA